MVLLRWLRLRILSSSERLKFCKSDLFCELHDEKAFSIMVERNSVFSLFLPWNIFYSAELFGSAQSTLNFLWTSYYFKHKHKSNMKGAISELGSSHLFWDQSNGEVLEIKCQACNFTGVLLFKGVFEDFGHIFPTCFLQNVCNKFAMLGNIKLISCLALHGKNPLRNALKSFYFC